MPSACCGRFSATRGRGRFVRPHVGRGTPNASLTAPLVPFLILLVAMMLGGVVYRGATVIFPAYLETESARIFQQISE